MKSLLSDEAQMAGLAGDAYDDGQFAALMPDEEATVEEETAMAIGMDKVMEDLFSDETMPKFANIFHSDQRELGMTVIPTIVKPVLLGAKQEIEEQTDEPAPASVFFAEGGLLQFTVDKLFAFAQQLQIPGSQDPDQLAAAYAGAYKAAAEHILETNDTDAMAEAMELGGEMLAEKEAGTTDLDEAQKVLQKRMKKKGNQGALQESIQQGLLG